MAEPRSLSSCERLESEENLAFQERSWRWEMVGRWACALLVLAALVGLFGSGPLSHAEKATEDGKLRVEYPRFARTDTTYQILVYIAAAAVENGHADVWIDSDLLEVLQIESLVPEPAEVELDRGRVVYRFRAAPTDDLAPVVLNVKTDGSARHVGQIGLRDGGSVKLALWLYP